MASTNNGINTQENDCGDQCSSMNQEAFVTLATNDNYANGALVLGDSLRRVGTSRKLAVLITNDVTEIMRNRLSKIWDFVIEVQKLHSDDAAILMLIERPELAVTFTKLKIWTLTQFNKCVFLDADTLVLQNIDELFERSELSAAPDIGWPDCFNSGVFVFVPSMETYHSLIEFANEHGSFDGGDQGLLNLYFKDWATDLSYHLPFVYNMVSNGNYTYLPAYLQYGKDAKVVHFLGASKPWNQHFDYSRSQISSASRPTGSSFQPHFAQIWWERYNSLQPPQDSVQQTIPVEAVQEATNEGPENKDSNGYESNDASRDEKQQAWERGDIDYTNKDRFNVIQHYLNHAIDGTSADQVYVEESFEYFESEQVQDFEIPSEQSTQEQTSFQVNYGSLQCMNYDQQPAESDYKQEEAQQDQAQEICTSDYSSGYDVQDEDLSYAGNVDVLDPERARQLRWENDHIDFGGEDRFEMIQKYLDDLIEELERTRITAQPASPVEPSSKAESSYTETVSTATAVSESESSYSPKLISKSTQTCTVYVSKAVQTEFEETSVI